VVRGLWGAVNWLGGTGPPLHPAASCHTSNYSYSNSNNSDNSSNDNNSGASSTYVNNNGHSNSNSSHSNSESNNNNPAPASIFTHRSLVPSVAGPVLADLLAGRRTLVQWGLAEVVAVSDESVCCRYVCLFVCIGM
jgi:hypothetical protein